MSEKRIAFVAALQSAYGVNENLGRYLYERWGIESRVPSDEIKTFITSDIVKQIFFPEPLINRAKNYSTQDFEQLKTSLAETIDAEKRIFRDSRFGFVWREKYNGMAGDYSGLFELLFPEPDDSSLVNVE